MSEETAKTERKVQRPPLDSVQSMIQDRPYVAQQLQLQILYDMAGILEGLAEDMTMFRGEFKATIPKGTLWPIEKTVTTTPTILDAKTEPTMPWRSFILVNEGPSDLYVGVNQDLYPKTGAIPAEEVHVVDMKVPIIKVVALRTTTGSTTVRIYAQE